MIVVGDAGSGKSSVLAKVADRWTKKDEKKWGEIS